MGRIEALVGLAGFEVARGCTRLGLVPTRAVERTRERGAAGRRAAEPEHPSQSMDTYQPFPNKPHLSINTGGEIQFV